MKYKLREYQQNCSDTCVEFFNSDKKNNAIVVMPTGSGKSLIIADIAKQLDTNILILQPSKEILEQNFSKLIALGVKNCSIYSASLNSKKIDRITFATIGSIVSKIEQFSHFKYIIIDECHLVNSKQGMYLKAIKEIGARVIGLTATPYRLNTNSWGSSLNFLTRTRPRIFSEMIYYEQISSLVEKGYLTKLKYYNIPTIDESSLTVNSTGMNYTDRSIHQHYEKIDYKNKLLEIIQRLIKSGRKNILVFTQFVDESEFLKENLKECCELVSGKTKKKERERVINGFKNGEIKVVTNVGVLTTGFDFPELETVVLARATRSLGLYYQMVGRAIRPFKNKDAWIVDLSGTYKRFGKVEELKIDALKNNLWHIENHKGEILTNKYF